jgi:hypothetical protein
MPRIAVWLLLFGCSFQTGKPVPPNHQQTPILHFEDYPVREVYHGKPARIVWPPDSDSNDACKQKFTERVKEVVAHGPNFAGHYALAHWGCGTGVSSISIVDLKSGAFLAPLPYQLLDVGWDPSGKVEYKAASFRLRSALLIASGCFDIDLQKKEAECGTKYFVLRESGFVLLKYIPGSIPPNLRRSIVNKPAQR